MAVRTTKPVVDVVVVPGVLYSRVAGAEAWVVAEESDPEAYFSPLGGVGLSSEVGAELDFLDAPGAVVKASGAERVDGVVPRV